MKPLIIFVLLCIRLVSNAQKLETFKLKNTETLGKEKQNTIALITTKWNRLKYLENL